MTWNLEEDLREEIEERIRIFRSTAYVNRLIIGEKDSEEDLKLFFSTLKQMTSTLTLLDFYNEHFYDEELINLQEELNSDLISYDFVLERILEAYVVMNNSISS